MTASNNDRQMITITMPLESAKEVLAATEFVSWENEDFTLGVSLLKLACIEKPKAGAQVHRLALIDLTSMGSDIGLVLNEELVMTADPGLGDDVDEVEDLANRLSLVLDLPVQRPSIDGHDGWQWSEIIDRLVGRGDLRSTQTASKEG